MSRKRYRIPIVPSEAAENDAVLLDGMGHSIRGRAIKGNIYLRMAFGRNLFDEIINRFGKTGWNQFIERVGHHWTYSICPCPALAEESKACQPFYMEIDLSGECFNGLDLSGLYLVDPDFEKADFTKCNLAGCVFGGVTRAIFRRADLTGAELAGDVSGADFTEAALKGIRLRHATYLKADPPIGLPKALMKRLSTYPGSLDDKQLKLPLVQDETPTEEGGSKLEPNPLITSIRLNSMWGELHD